MLKFRTGLLLAALLLCACDHHKKTNQAQAEAGTAAVGQNDSELTGEPSTPATNAPVYPRALPVANTSTPTAAGVPATNGAAVETASAPTTPPPDTNAPTSAQTPDVASSVPPAMTSSTDTTSVITPPPANPAVSSTATPSSDTGADTSRLTLNTPNPVAASTPAATTEEQVVIIDTTLGRIVIETDDSAAPKTSENFRKLAADGFYNHTIFHRVIPHFIIQGGDPNSLSEDRSIQGKGGPGYTLPPEIKLKHDRGAVAMARSPDSVNPRRESNGSQFYICVVDCPSLDDQYTVFGHVIKGMDVVEAIANQARDNRDNPLNRIEMEVTLEPKEQALSEGSASSP
ncbi:MAG: peptidylprolyl isomerase [Methylacidiphilales bacterium]|nr:peptidylprolyl isomerase [Candidatus Methylacidiphilales bacterium]